MNIATKPELPIEVVGPAPAPDKAPNLDYLTGLRGLAAYAVLIGHAILFGTQSLALPTLRGYAEFISYFGISLFFVLSGFVIYYNYLDAFRTQGFGRAAYRFLAARFARLYPLYALIILVSSTALPTPQFVEHPIAGLAYLTLTQSWFNTANAIFPPAWTISTEWFFYLAFMLAAPVVVRARFINPLILLVPFLVIAWMLIYRVFEHRADLNALVPAVFFHNASYNFPLEYWIWYVSPYVRIMEFIAGAMACAIFLRSCGGDWITRRGCVVMELSALAWSLFAIHAGATGTLGSLGPVSTNFMFAPALVVILLCGSAKGSLLSSVLERRPFVMLGEISYSVYMFQMIAMICMAHVTITDSASLSGIATIVFKVGAICFLATLMAYGSYYLYEMPARRAIRRVLGAG